jgi:transposase
VEQISRIGMDTSKHIFQLHGVNTAEEPVLRKKLRRKEMFAFLEKLAPTVIAIEDPWRRPDRRGAAQDEDAGA